MVFSFLETMIKDGMKVFLEQAVGFLDDLKNVVAEIEDIKATTTLKKDTEKEVQKIYSQLDTIVDGLNKQSKKVQSKIAKVEEMFVGFINESNKRNKSMQDKMKEEIKADITAFGPLFNNLKETLKTAENDILRNREDLEKMLEKKLEKGDLKYLEDGLQKTFIDDENISDKTAYSSKKTIEKIDSMINNLRLGGRGKIFIQNDGIDLGQATAINFTGSGVTTTVENGIHTVDISGGGAGAVDSVNGQTGVVVLDADDIDDTSTTNKFVTSGDLAKLSNITVTQAVDLDQMEADIDALANGMVYKGNWDASAGTFPGSGTAQTGWFYTVSVGGTVDGVVFNVDDRLVATIDNASATVYAGNWTKLDATDAVTSVNGDVGNVTVQSLQVVVSSSQTAVIDEVYVVVATSTFTDPSPVEGKGFKVIVRNGTATVGGTGYSVAGSEILRIFHSGAWANYLKTPSSGVNTGDQTSIVGISGTKAQFDTACSDGNFLYTGDIVGGDTTNNIGYLNIPQNSQSSAYTTVLGDSGKHIYHPSSDTTARTWTIDSNANVPYPIGTAITFVNDTSAGTITIAITSDTLVLAGAGTTGSRTLTANGVATAIKVTSTRWIISGTNLT